MNWNVYFSRNASKQAEKLTSPTQTGTGGTPFIKYLEQHGNDVLSHKIKMHEAVADVQIL